MTKKYFHKIILRKNFIEHKTLNLKYTYASHVEELKSKKFTMANSLWNSFLLSSTVRDLHTPR